MMAGSVTDGMMTGVLLDGTKVGNKRMTIPQVHLSLGCLDLGVTSCRKLSEWVKMNLDTGAVVSTFPLNFGPDGAGDGRFYRTASGEWIPDGVQFKGYDGFASIFERKTHWSTQGVVSCCRNCSHGKTRFLLGT